MRIQENYLDSFKLSCFEVERGHPAYEFCSFQEVALLFGYCNTAYEKREFHLALLIVADGGDFQGYKDTRFPEFVLLPLLGHVIQQLIQFRKQFGTSRNEISQIIDILWYDTLSRN